MNNRILAGTKIVVTSTQETIRTEAYATVGLEGWETNAELPEDENALVKTLSTQKESLLVAILEPDGIKFDHFMKLVREANIPDSQLVVGCPKGSFVHRAFLRTGIEGFPFNIETTPTGQMIDLSSFPTALQTVWQKHCSLQLDRELTEAMESSALSLMKMCTGIESTAMLKERAHLAFSLTNHINFDLNFRKRVIRLSLFSDLITHEHWKDVVAESRNLWVIKDLLESRAAFTQGNVVTALSWPSTMPMELAIVETAILVQKKTTGSKTGFKEQLQQCSRGLSLEIRTSLNQAVDACFNRIWSKTDDRKTSNSS